jgi:hypothetical protein
LVPLFLLLFLLLLRPLLLLFPSCPDPRRYSFIRIIRV